jgi:serine protease Do
MSAIQELQGTIQEVAKQVGPAVVGLGRGWRAGTGVVVAEGEVLTAAHNLRGDEPGAVTFTDGRREAAHLTGIDRDLDLAVLAVETAGTTPVEWANEGDALEVGSTVVALSNPGGRGLRATLGFVSAPERTFRGPGGRRIPGIEHTAPVPRGSSGSPLLDPQGRLRGLNAIRLEGGLIVAIPADAGVRRRIDGMRRGEQSSSPRLGVAVAPAYVARRLRRAVGLPERDGVLVRAVEDGGAASAAGIRKGDLIVEAGGKPVDGIDALHDALGSVEPKGTLALTLLRGADELRLEVSFDRAHAATEA